MQKVIKNKIIAGAKYGRLTAISFSHKNNRGSFWNFICDCGNIKTIRQYAVMDGKTKSCRRCFRGVNIELVPEGSKIRFIKTTTLSSKQYNGKWTQTRALYECVCGKKFEANVASVKSGNTTSCGCYKTKLLKQNGSLNGLSTHPLYRVLANIKSRCYYPKNSGYSRYGERGVRVCEQWLNDFKAFYDWAISNGWEKGMQIDKDIIPKKLGITAILYSPEMCSIVTNKENSNCTVRSNYMSYNGETKTLSEWSEITGIHISTIHNRLNSKFRNVEDIFSEVRGHKKYKETTPKNEENEQWAYM